MSDGAVGTDESGDVPGQSDAETLAPTTCGRRLLEAVRADEDPGPYLSALERAGDDALAPLRRDRAAALAFWTNVYNAGTQLLLERRPELYEGPLRFVRFFRAPCVTVAGTELGLDDIEQGILRGSRSKYGLGYVPRFRPGAFERRYRLDGPDPRVHFALNCGAGSCPAIRAYAADRIDDQLDLATGAYLESTVEYDPDADAARVPRLFLWYRGDFGGKAGIREFLRAYDAIPEDASPRLRYRSWDWSLDAGDFAD